MKMITDDIDYFFKLANKCSRLSENITRNKDLINEILMKYQPASMTQYEIDHCLYTLMNINKLQNYLQNHADIYISVFLPSNLPIYSLLLSAVIPSFAARKIVLRANTQLVEQVAVQKLMDILELPVICSNIEVFLGGRNDFLKNYVAQSDLVIFTGRNTVKDLVKTYMKSGSYLINSGSGHNPIVVGKGADIEVAVKSVLYARFFNGGQDCAGPDAVFVHQSFEKEFIEKLIKGVLDLKIGDHADVDSIVGKIHRKEELERLQDIIDQNKKNIIFGGKIDFQNKVAHPTIVLSSIDCNDLNYNEIFGPILFLYVYHTDDQLRLYFQNGKYSQNKMYVSLFGESDYIKSRDDNVLIKSNEMKKGIGRILYNTIINDLVVDNGFTSYGGYSKGASSISYIGAKCKTIAMPILIPEVMYSIFVQKNDINNLIVINPDIKSKDTEKENKQKTLRELSVKFINLVTEKFKENLVFSFIIDKMSVCNIKENKNNPEVFLCLKNVENEISSFVSNVKVLYDRFDLTVEKNPFIGIVNYWYLSSEIYHLYYQMYGINYNPWLDDNKCESGFLTQFKCSDSRTYEVVFWAAVISLEKKMALVSRNKEMFKKLEENSKDLMNNLMEELYENITTIGVPNLLRENYPELNNEEIIEVLKSLNCFNVVKLLG